MLKKLRIKFIALNMTTVVVVLAIAFTAILVINYQQNMQEVEETLEAAISDAVAEDQEETGGATPLLSEARDQLFSFLGDSDSGLYPLRSTMEESETESGPAEGENSESGEEAKPEADEGAEDSAASSGVETDAGESGAVEAVDAETDADENESESGDEGVEVAETTDDGDGDDGVLGVPPAIGGDRGSTGPIIPVAVYTVSSDGSLEAASQQNTASISDDILAQAAEALADVEDGTGTLTSLELHYQKRTVEDTIYLAFCDISATSEWQDLAGTLSIIGLAAFVVFFIISLFFSRWALKPVAQAWDQQRQFVADASHDLKTPLTVILANTSIIMEHPERTVASQSQWIESTQHEAENMQVLVNDLLLLAQLDEGKAEPVFEVLDFSDLVEGEVLQFESVAFERLIDLESTIDPGIEARGDPSRLGRLVSSLIDNACKYADDGGRVDVELHQRGQNIVYTVHNTGPAIPPEDLPHIFDRFYRGDKARTHSENSYGLGLAIAYGIAQEHGGDLTVKSNEAEGTTFTATLPVPEKADKAEKPARTGKAKGAGKAETAEAADRTSGTDGSKK